MNAPQRNDPVAIDRYEIRLEGQLDQRWSDWFEGFTLTNASDGTTTLTGHVIDQAENGHGHNVDEHGRRRV